MPIKISQKTKIIIVITTVLTMLYATGLKITFSSSEAQSVVDKMFTKLLPTKIVDKALSKCSHI